MLNKSVTYEGEEYTRDSVTEMVKTYQDKNVRDLKELETLRKVHDDIASEMNRDLIEQRSAWDYVKAIVMGDKRNMTSNFKGLLERIPIVGNMIPDRPLQELLQDKIAVAEKRTKEMVQFLDK